MKKILSVALSTAMAFSMFASVAFGADAKLTPEQQFNALKEAGIVSGFPDGLSHLERTLTRAELAKIIVNSLSLEPVDATSYNDKNYANHWGRPYIEAATQAGILNGKDAVKKLFDPNGAVTVQELAKVLVTALKLEVPADANNTASEWAKGYVAAAVNAGYLADGINYQAQATRSQAVVAAYAIYEAAQFKVTKAEAIDATHVKLTLSNGETVEVTLEKALEPNKATELEYTTADGKVLKYTVTYVVTTATKVESVKADNLREVKVAFDGEVDAATAEDASNYSISSDETTQEVEVVDATLSADKKVVTLTVEDKADENEGLENQVKYTLDLSNVRAGSNVISASDLEFTPVDAALPVAQSAQALGNKTIKVTFSEPVKADVSATNFTVDGAAVVGSTDVSGNVVILKLYTTLSNGEHTINVSGVSDFSGLLNLSTDLKFSVVEDTTAPTIVSVENATFEYVTLKFSEAIDPSTISVGNVYWLKGTTEYPVESFKQLSDDTFRFNFSEDNKLQYATTLYVSGVADYSGNVIAKDASIAVNPVLDQTRPEVVSVKMGDDVANQLIVKYTKAVEKETAEDMDNYVIKNSSGDVVAEYKEIELSEDGKTATINLISDLTEGATYTLTISNVTDTTTLRNVILPYTTSFTVANVTAPTADSAYFVTDSRKIVVNYSKAMLTSGTGSILDKNNYVVHDSDNNTWKALPSGATIVASSNGKSAIITFPKSSTVAVDDFDWIRVSGVKSATGKTLSGLTKDLPLAEVTPIAVESAEATATNKIKVTFDQTIQTATTSDFTVKNTKGDSLKVISVSVDDDDVYLTLSSNTKLTENGLYDGAPVEVTVNANKTLVNPAGIKFTDAATREVSDKIAPMLSSVTAATYDKDTGRITATLKFSEAVDEKAGAEGSAVYDLAVVVDGDTIDPSDYTVTFDGNEATLEITGVDEYAKNWILKVKVVGTPHFIVDGSNNTVSASSNYVQKAVTLAD
ncbi:S-layer homology domain-containing protein [Paenibacillus barengoltzii]|nr:S-layer homology domain-containing protein [Paenibacillus barengoltzii]